MFQAAAAMWFGVDWATALLAIATTFLAAFAALAIVGYFVSWRGVLESAKSRQTLVYLDLNRRWESEELLLCRADITNMTPARFQEHFRVLKAAEDPTALLRLYRIANFFEDLSIFEKQGYLEVGWIEQSLGSTVHKYWKIWELAIVEERGADEPFVTDAELLYENWENLARTLERRRSHREGHHPRRWHRRSHH